MTGIFGELRRRGVFGALTAYGVAAAGALQLADIIVHDLDLPAWTLRALIWAAAVGFAVTAVVSWSYDLTRRGFVRTQGPADRSPQTPRRTTLPTPQPPPVPRELVAGAVLAGRYRIERELGKGGMGRVLVARDEKLGRRVAVKVVTAAHDPARVRRFEQEARTAGALEHPNVLAVYDLGEQDGVPFLVTELLEGHTLRTVIEGPRLPPAQVQGLALQLARGLAAAHARGVVHRDLKPENLFLTDDGRLKILDFGLARLSGNDERAPGLTLTGAIFGSPGYLSPEQARGERAGAPSDVFSAGAVLYEMLSGKRAFPGASLIEAGHAALSAEPCFRVWGKARWEPGAPVTLPPRPRSWRRSTSLMVAMATLALGIALASALRLSRSAGRNVPHESIDWIPSVPIPPVPPVPPVPPANGHPPGLDADAEKIARDVRKQLELSIPREGSRGLIAGARALERANREARAQELLRRSRDPIARLELFLLQRRQGQLAQATKELQAFSSGVAAGEWPAPLLRAYLGEMKDDAVLAAATDPDEQCDAYYYLGRLHAPDDAPLARRQLLQAANEDCDQAEFAREELQALQSR